MILESNRVYAVGLEVGPGQRLRILHAEETCIYGISVDTDHPEPLRIDSTAASLMRWEPTADPWAGLRATHDAEIAQTHRDIRDRANKGLELLLSLAREDSPPGCRAQLRLLDPNHRYRLIHAAAQQVIVPINSMRRWLNRYWVRGMCRNALLPDVISMSGAGMTRSVPAAACDSRGNPLDPNFYKKPGRAPGNGQRIGTRMTEPVRGSIETLGRRLYLQHPKNSVRDTYAKWKDAEKSIAPSRYPTPQAFYSILVKDPVIAAAIKSRGLVGRKPSIGAAESEAMHARVPGPGFCYQGDSTPLPRIRVQGQQATLYFASDTYTSAIVGYYCYHGNPSANAHSRCLAHAASEKPSYCKQFGITITDDEWPMQVVPEAWVADRGEMIGPIADYLVSSFHINLQNTPAYSPQLKADVEASFGGLLRGLISKLDDHVQPRPGRRYGDTIDLTMHELHVLIIRFVLAYNSRKLRRVPTPSQMTREVWMTPLSLWNKEKDRLLGEGRSFTREELLLAKSKRAEAMLTESGLTFQGLTYVCRENGVEALQALLGQRSKRVYIQYVEDSTDQVLIQRKQLRRIGAATVGPLHEYVDCMLDSRDAAWAGYTFPAFLEAYRKHTEATQDLYEYHDERRAALSSGIADQKAGNLATPAAPPSRDIPDVASSDGTVTIPAPESRTPDPEVVMRSSDRPESSTPPALAGPTFSALRRARDRRNNPS